MTDINSPEGLISNFQTQLEHQWSRFRAVEADDSSRGSSYETALQNLLQEYFGGRFDILSNCSVMDSELDCFDTFGKNAKNEIDVVALFSHASPRIILRETDVNWIPLEGISFLCEVKSRIDKGRLDSDLEKLEILRRLERDPDDRFATKVHGEYCVDHQLHCLVYDCSSIADETLNALLTESTAWDMVLLVEEDTLIVNNTLPAARYIRSMAITSQIRRTDVVYDELGEVAIPSEGDESILSVDNGLAWFIIALSITIPVPIGVSTVSSLSELITRSFTGIRHGAASSVNEQDGMRCEPADSEDTDKKE